MVEPGVLAYWLKKASVCDAATLHGVLADRVVASSPPLQIRFVHRNLIVICTLYRILCILRRTMPSLRRTSQLLGAAFANVFANRSPACMTCHLPATTGYFLAESRLAMGHGPPAASSASVASAARAATARAVDT